MPLNCESLESVLAAGADAGASLLDAVDLPILVVGVDCRIIHFNRPAAAALHIARQDIGRSPGNILSETSGLDAACAQAIAEGVHIQREIRVGGHWFTVGIGPHYAPDGPCGAVLTFTNATAPAATDLAIYDREDTHAILNTINDPLLVLDSDLRIQTANQAFYAMFGCSREEVLHKRLPELGGATWKTSSVWHCLQAARNQNTEFESVEVDLECAALGRRTLLISAGTIWSGGDALLLVALRDITEHKKVQEAVLHRGLQFQTLLDKAPLGVFLIDANFRVREANPMALATFGDLPGGVADRDFVEIMHLLWEKQDAEELVGIFHRTLETGESYFTTDWSKRRADRGITEHYEWRADRILLPDGGFGVVCYFRDIRERKLAALNANLFASIVESSADAIVSKDLNGTILSWNRGAERLFGYTAAEAVGKSIAIIIPPDRLDEEPRILERIARSEKVEHFETMRKTKDGSHLTVSLTISPVTDASGRVVGASKIARDVTAKVRQQEALQAAHAALEHANADLQQFAYSVAHDLHEPMRTVAIYAELLQQTFAEKLGPTGEEFVGRTIEGVRRLEELLRDLRTYTQVSTAKQAPTGDADANKALEKTVSNLEVAIRESGASIEAGHLPHVWMHEVELEQVFQNLIGNAIRYRSQASPRIQIAAERRGKDWLFSVQDNGIGIEPQFREQIFGMFKRLHTASDYPGTGMGLAICKRIIERSGGRLWVESQSGKGSTFYFTVPDRRSATSVAVSV